MKDNDKEVRVAPEVHIFSASTMELMKRLFDTHRTKPVEPPNEETQTGWKPSQRSSRITRLEAEVAELKARIEVLEKLVVRE